MGPVVFSIFIMLFSLVQFGVAAFTLWWMLHAWRTPETLESTKFNPPDGD
jgi:hypothetical protein